MAVKDESPPAPRRRQADRSAATRAALLTAARELFARDGYAGAGREAIAERAGVSRGALYHHFGDKEGLFRAVYEALEAEVMGHVAQAALRGGTDPLGQLRSGALAYLDVVVANPAVQRIVLLDGPSVLAPQTRQEIVETYAVGLVREVLRAGMDSGAITAQPLEPLTHVLLAALHEAALYVARAADHQAAGAEVRATVDHFLAGLAAPTPTRAARGPKEAKPKSTSAS